MLTIAQQIAPDLHRLNASYTYFIDTYRDLGQDDMGILLRLLHHDPRQGQQPDNAIVLFVLPRLGTISPWSNKATDILRHCGLDHIKRIERGICWSLHSAPHQHIDKDRLDQIKAVLHDRMTETVIEDIGSAKQLFATVPPASFARIHLLGQDRATLIELNKTQGLALSTEECDYLLKVFSMLGRDPSDTELMMFAQANSEHCRHKIFNAKWTINGQEQAQSLLGMIQETYKSHPGYIISAYHDNAAIMRGYPGSRLFPDPNSGHYQYHEENINILIKTETHNHPTAIAPCPGAATGSGGELRDEAATGRGGKPKAGLTGFAVANLKIPGYIQAWEKDYGRPDHICAALDIMLAAPIGAAAYNNEFGRPALCGYFRTYEQMDERGEIYSYHKPIMLAGGHGMIRDLHTGKKTMPVGAKLCILGGPAMSIGLGGGSASSRMSVADNAGLDFASVQRDNAEMQRRCQEVIDYCWAMGADNPIITIHDVGAGGLSNAIPEMVHDSKRGALLQLRAIPNDEPGMSPVAIWCNEAQERYVLSIDPVSIDIFKKICAREHAPFAILGTITEEQQLVVQDALFANTPIDIPIRLLLDGVPKQTRAIKAKATTPVNTIRPHFDIEMAITRVLQLPAVADKRFLITIGDRTISGLVVRDQMVGPWQVPVADCAVTATDYQYYTGEAMAIGERPAIAVINASASGRMAVAEAITNICAARILTLADIAFSANWMAACDGATQDLCLYQAVHAVKTLCIELGIAIPVGKDSLSMHTHWWHNGIRRQAKAPLSLNLSAFARVADIRQSLTPELKRDQVDTVLVLIDLGHRHQRLAGSALFQTYNLTTGATPDIEDSSYLVAFFRAIQILNESGLLLAYHDRSDGGLITTLCEMAFAGRCGIDVTLAEDDLIRACFNEEAGAVIQVQTHQLAMITETLTRSGLPAAAIKIVGTTNYNERVLRIRHSGKEVYRENMACLQQRWSKTSFYIQSLRDNPKCAQQEYEQIQAEQDPGLSIETTFRLDGIPSYVNRRPKVLLLRTQGVNGQLEMAAAFTHAGFDCIDVHMHDLLHRHTDLAQFNGLVVCGGFSYGDVFGAGSGWASSILLNSGLRELFQYFFERDDTFTLGVCNGCQMLSRLRELIPGAEYWPTFIKNESAQFEARLVMVEITPSPSILFANMAGSRLPIAVAHGEGRVDPGSKGRTQHLALRYIDHHGKATMHYPCNPNGSPGGMTAFTSTDGRATIMMPHPERVFLRKQLSWCPQHWRNEHSPWMQLFLNARIWLA